GTPVLFLRAPDSMLFTLSGTPSPPPLQTPAAPATPPEQRSRGTVPTQGGSRQEDQTPTKEMYLKEGDVFYRRAEYEKALTAYKQAITLDPGYVLALYGKANSLWRLYRFQEAVASYSRVLELNPHHEEAQKDRAAAIAALKQFEEESARWPEA